MYTPYHASIIHPAHFIGSLRACTEVPDDIKRIYETIWDMDPRDLIDMAADRAPFIDQSQSLTLGLDRPTPEDMVRNIRVCMNRG